MKEETRIRLSDLYFWNYITNEKFILKAIEWNASMRIRKYKKILQLTNRKQYEMAYRAF